MNKVALGAQIRSARKDKELTSDKLAEAVGLTDTYLRQIESGTKTPSLPVLISICNVLHVSPNYLLTEDLEDNELDACMELQELWNEATPSQTVLIKNMIVAATNTLRETEK